MATDVSAQEGTAKGRETLVDLFVVDADVHVHEEPAELAEYAVGPWDVALREIATIQERYLDLPGMSPRAEYRVPFPGGSNRRQVVRGAGEMRAGLDALHVDQAVLFPDHLLALAMVRDPGFATTLAEAYNRWLHERWLLPEPSLKGALVIAPQNPEAGAADIRRHAGEREFACVYLPASGLKILYGHELYDPVYRAASEAGLPVVIHSVEAVYPAFPFQLEQFRTSMAVHALAHPLAMVANLVSMLETGVHVRFPDLKVGFMEAGTGWIPWIANRLDKEYIERRREVPLLQERPSRSMRRFFYGTQPIEEPERRGDVVALFELFDGENTAMFASDWPHHDFDHPQHVFGLPFSSEARRKIMGLNAARFFGLDVPADVAPTEHAIGRAEDLPEGQHRVVRVAIRELGVFNVGGAYHALPNLCPHQRGPLCEGGVSGTIDAGPHTDWKLAWIWEGEVVTCPWHALEFHIPSGRCVAFEDIRLRTYEVRVVDGELRVLI